MKRLLLLFNALLFVVSGAMADKYYFATGPKQVTSITSGNYYVIDGLNQQSGGTAGHYLFDNGTKVTSNDPQALPTDWTAGKFIWKIVGNSNDGYTLQNVQTGKYMSLGSSNGSQISSSSTSQTNGIYFNGSDSYATILNSNGQAIDIGSSGSNPTTWSGTTTASGSRRLAIYEVEVVEIEDDACYTIDFVSKDKTKTWGLKSGTSAVSTLTQGETGDVYVAHSYTNKSGNKRWIFVNNSNGTYLEYHGQASSQFSITNANNEFEMNALTTSWSKVDNDADCSGRLFIRAGRRNCGSYPDNVGAYILNESNGKYDNSDDPFYNGSFTSALTFTATGDEVSATATLAIAKFEALYEVKDYLTYASNISALFADPSSIASNINSAETASDAATIATNFMKSPEGKKFYAVNSTATGQYMNIGTSQITATSTKLYSEAVMEVEYAGNSKYYLKGVKSGYYTGNPNSGTTNPGTQSTKGAATPLFIGNIGSTDNQVYFAKTKVENAEAIHYSSGYTDQARVVAWTYNAEASQWNITNISDEDYEALSNLCDVTYRVLVEASGTVKDTNEDAIAEIIGSTISLPSDLSRDFCTYTFYSDAACSSSLTTIPDAASTTIYALAETNAPFTVSTAFASATWYNMKLQDRYPLYDSGNTPNVTLPDAPGSTENNVEWAFIGNPYDGFQIINKGAGDGKVLGAPNGAKSDGNTGANTHATFATAGTQDNERWFPKSSTHSTNGFFLFDGEKVALNYRSANNLAFWTGGYDSGSTFTVSSVTDNATELTGIATRLGNKTFGSGYGEYSLSGDYAGDESSMAGTIIPGWSSYSYKNLLDARGYDAAKSLNVPQTGDFLRIKASATNKSDYSVASDIYLTSSNTQSEVNNSAYKDKRLGFSLGTANDNTTIFYYDGDSHLTGFANGLQPIMNGDNQMQIGAVAASATIVTFESIEATENKAFRIEFNNGGRSLYTQRYSGVYFTDAASGNATDAHYRYFLEKVTSLPITITTADWATLYSPVALTIPDGVTAYYAEKGDGYLSMRPITDGKIPANQGVLIYKDVNTATTIDFDITTGGTITSDLTGTIATINKTDDMYYFSRGTLGKLAFYQEGDATTMKGFKAFYQAEGESPVKELRFDDVTSVNDIMSTITTSNGIFHDLSGRQVSKPTKGIYVVNGKKVVIK